MRTSIRSKILLATMGLGLWTLSPQAAPSYTAWSVPENLGPVVNSPYDDLGPGLSKDRLSLYFSSNRPGGIGGMDIWVTVRASEDAPWQAPVNLGPAVNTSTYEAVPSLSRDGHWLLFHSARDGGLGQWDIWVAWRRHVHDDLGWDTPFNLGAAVNTPFDESGARLVQQDRHTYLMFNSTRPGGMGSQDIYQVELRRDGTFGPVEPVVELNSPWFDNRPAVRFDALELFMFSNRPGTVGDQDLWVSTRNSMDDPWSAPVNLGNDVNTVQTDFLPEIASDRVHLYFASNRPGGSGQMDLYVSRRDKMFGTK